MTVVKKGVVVIDNGTGYTKIGFAGRRTPEYVFPTMVGTPVVGKRIMGLKGLLHVSRPIERGRIRNWEKMKMLWMFSFDLLGVDPSGCKLFLTEPILSANGDREKMAEIMFEDFGVSGLYIGEQPLLAMYAHGGSTGLVVDIGHGLTQIAPIWEGFLVPRAIRMAPLGGGDITTYLVHLLMEKGYYLATLTGMEIAKDIKEKLCYVSLNPEAEARELVEGPWYEDLYRGIVEKRAEVQIAKGLYRLADGTLIKVLEECFLAPEVLFNPPLLGLEVDPLPKLVMDSVMACDIDQRKGLLENIILCGGTSMMKGLGERLARELTVMLREAGIGIKPRIVMPKLREFYVWIGASKMAYIVDRRGLWITREEYKEHGSSIVHKRPWAIPA